MEGIAPQFQVNVAGGRFKSFIMSCNTILYFKIHKKTKQMVHLKYLFDAPMQNGGLKCILYLIMQNNGFQSYCFLLGKLVVNFSSVKLELKTMYYWIGFANKILLAINIPTVILFGWSRVVSYNYETPCILCIKPNYIKIHTRNHILFEKLFKTEGGFPARVNG